VPLLPQARGALFAAPRELVRPAHRLLRPKTLQQKNKRCDPLVIYITKEAILEKNDGDRRYSNCVNGALNYDLVGLLYFSHLLCTLSATRMSAVDVVCCRENESIATLFRCRCRRA
jgi:hypothetical protein